MKRWIVAASMLVCSVAAACPMCKDSIPNGETSAQAGSLPGGFNNSVYLLLLGLFATMGFMAVGIIKGIRSSDQRTILQQNSRGFEVRPSDSSPDEIE
jgi:hypothetical protein